MARFDKKWLFIHIPAGVVVAALLGFGVVQCDGKNEESAEKVKVQNQLVDAGKKMEIAASRMDSLLNVNRELGADNVRKGDTIRVLKDSVNTLNGRVRVLRAENDSLIVALDDCAKSKAKKTVKTKKNKTVVAKKNNNAPLKRGCCAGTETRTANVRLDGSYNNGNVLVDNAPTDANISMNNGAVNNGNVIVGGVNNVGSITARQVNVGNNNGNLVVENAARNTDVSLDGHSVNNGTIVVGNANTVYHVIPDTVVRFTTTKNTVVKCRVVTRQRQYR